MQQNLEPAAWFP